MNIWLKCRMSMDTKGWKICITGGKLQFLKRTYNRRLKLQIDYIADPLSGQLQHYSFFALHCWNPRTTSHPTRIKVARFYTFCQCIYVLYMILRRNSNYFPDWIV